GLSEIPHHLAISDRPSGASRIGHVLDFGGERPRASEPEDVAEAIRLAEVHGLGTGIVTVAADCEVCRRPAPPDAPAPHGPKASCPAAARLPPVGPSPRRRHGWGESSARHSGR